MERRCEHANSRCPEFTRKLGCISVGHHIYWPASDYRTPLEREFRELPWNIVPGMCKGAEQLLHDKGEKPPKPTEGFMQSLVDLYYLRKELGDRRG